MNFAGMVRKNIGTIVAGLGFLLLCILTFGDIGEITATEYWTKVWENITAISFMSIGLTVIQIAIKQGLAEQALQKGLNTDKTAEKYNEHRDIVKRNNERMIYLPYFLQTYNKRHTQLRKREFLINNNYLSEQALLTSGDKKAIEVYNSIIVHLTMVDMKWSTVDIVRNKQGKILTLDEHRSRRLKNSIMTSFAGMIGVTFLTGGLFFSPSTEPLWQKFVRLFTYCLAIAIGAIFTVIKEYEKGAFGVPNDLDEINQIWSEFSSWEIPDWVKEDVERLNREDELRRKEVSDVKERRNSEHRTNIQKQSEEGKGPIHFDPGGVVSVSPTDCDILRTDGTKQCR